MQSLTPFTRNFATLSTYMMNINILSMHLHSYQCQGLRVRQNPAEKGTGFCPSDNVPDFVPCYRPERRHGFDLTILCDSDKN